MAKAKVKTGRQDTGREGAARTREGRGQMKVQDRIKERK